MIYSKSAVYPRTNVIDRIDKKPWLARLNIGNCDKRNMKKYYEKKIFAKSNLSE